MERQRAYRDRRGRSRSAKKHSPGNGLCLACLRNLYDYGEGESRYCMACLKSMKRLPGIPLEDQRNGRSEVLLAERPIDDQSWRERSVCRDAPERLFAAPEDIQPPHIPRSAYAAVAEYCARCPVLESCGAEADDHEYPGVWGGAFRYVTAGRPPAYQARVLLGLKPPERDRSGRRGRERAARAEHAA